MLPDHWYEEETIDGFVVRRLRPEIVDYLIAGGSTRLSGWEEVPRMTHESDTVH